MNYIDLHRDEYLNEMEAELNHKEIDYEYRKYLFERGKQEWLERREKDYIEYHEYLNA